MPALFSTVLAVHVALATGCALLFWPPWFLDKGRTAHVRFGFAYLALLFGATTTALLLTLVSLIGGPEVRPAEGGLPLDPMVDRPGSWRAHLLLLAYVAVMTLDAAVIGLRALKQAPARRRLEGRLQAVLALVGLGFVAPAIRYDALPLAAVGLAGAALAFLGWHHARRLALDRAARLARHAVAMALSGVGLYSALAIVLGNRLAPEFFHGRAGVLVWVLPTLIGLPAVLVLRAAVLRDPKRFDRGRGGGGAPP